jgi:hypothetical protein
MGAPRGRSPAPQHHAHPVALLGLHAEDGLADDLQLEQPELLLDVHRLAAAAERLQLARQPVGRLLGDEDDVVQYVHAQRGRHQQALLLPELAVGRHQARAQDGQEGVVGEVQVLHVGLEAQLEDAPERVRAAHHDGVRAQHAAPDDVAARGVQPLLHEVPGAQHLAGGLQQLDDVAQQEVAAGGGGHWRQHGLPPREGGERRERLVDQQREACREQAHEGLGRGGIARQEVIRGRAHAAARLARRRERC